MEELVSRGIPAGVGGSNVRGNPDGLYRLRSRLAAQVLRHEVVAPTRGFKPAAPALPATRQVILSVLPRGPAMDRCQRCMVHGQARKPRSGRGHRNLAPTPMQSRGLAR